MLYLIFFIILLLSELAYFRIADKFNIIDKPNHRSSHSRVTLLGGGVVFYLGALLYSLWFGLPYPWLVAGLTLIAAISMADDIRPVPRRLRLFFHFAAMLLLFAEWGLFAGLPWWYLAVALVFCTGIINAFNFMDGINGITGGYSLVVLLALTYINATTVVFIDAPFLYTVILSVLVFNFFNFRKRARCFAGDVGAVSIAFVIVFAMGKLILLTGDWTYLVLLAVYGADSVLTIARRLALRENIFEAHRKHAYQLMANELGLPHVLVSGIYMMIQVLVVVGFLMVPVTARWYYLVAVLLVLGAGYGVCVKKARKSENV
jgi:UDP-N-acetylmuramyl pentapeptide phosphotransferase/UDP-N-acetylglucosamine-1-phosphate transferase